MSLPSSYLLDTNSISETRRKTPSVAFDAFFQRLEPQAMFLSILTLGELRKGVANRRKKDIIGAKSLESWVDGVERKFTDRILGVDMATMRLWGELSAGRTRPVIGTMLAATAILHDLTLLTRNIADFQDLPVRWVNPWAT